MKTGNLVIALAFFLVLSLSLCSAELFPEAKDKYVNDFAKIFTQEQTAELRAILMQVDQNTTAEIVLVSINNLSGYSSSDYAINLFQQWKIGKSDKDNGLLNLYALAENKIWVTTGYGLEGILPDSKLGRLLDEYYVPLRDSNKSTEGILIFTREIAKILEENKAEIISGRATNPNLEGDKWIAVMIMLFLLIILPRIIKTIAKNKKIKKGKPNTFWDALFWFMIGNSLGRNSSSFGGGYSGGGFSGGFGGGSTGGGGAGR